MSSMPVRFPYFCRQCFFSCEFCFYPEDFSCLLFLHSANMGRWLDKRKEIISKDTSFYFFKGYRYGVQDLYIADYNLFWYDIRNNVKSRIGHFGKDELC